jgi:hypothetical protein
MPTKSPPLFPEPDEPDRPPLAADPPGPGAWEVADLIAAGVLDAVPGDPPVPISVWRAHGPNDPPSSPLSLFDGLTPRLAAMLIATYTSPGQSVIDMTGDLAVEGAAGAGGRIYRRVDRPPTDQQRRDLAHAANLVLLRWPPPPTLAPNPGTPRPAANPGVCGGAPGQSYRRRHRTTPDPSAVLGLCRELLAESAHTIVILTPPPTGAYRDHARSIIPAANRAGLGYLQHLVIVTTPFDELLAPPRPPTEDMVMIRSHLDLLVFVLRRRP